MKPGFLLSGVAVLVIGSGVALAAPVVEVDFVSPDRYSDASPYSRPVDERERDAVLEQLRRHMQLEGAKFLSGDNDRLKIEVLDVDLAGEVQLTRDGREHRILAERMPPRINLRYTLVRGGVECSREERVTELGYLFDPNQCRFDGALCREKVMLDKWFKRTLGPGLAGWR